ncbi:MAG TPA: (deoxy)nucleoside triphosphate pyrophosphohydrolase [Geobacteraceae bacterium]
MYPLLVTAAIIEDQGRVLLTRRREGVPYPLYWEFPGGKVEASEDPRDCIVREVREELAIDVTVEGIYDVVYHRYPERTVLVMAYRCRWLSGEVTNVEVSEHCWAKPAELKEFNLLPADVPLAERICREFGHEDTSSI